MNIFNHIIKDDEITGIGPLLWNEQGFGPTVVFYTFKVLTKQSSFEIKSEVCEAFGYLDESDKQKLQAFNMDYWLVRKNIAQLLGDSNTDHNPLMDQLQQQHDALCNNYQQLYNQLQPVIKRSKSRELIMELLGNLSANIIHFKSLAAN